MKDTFISSEGEIGRLAFTVRVLLLALVASLIAYFAVDYFSDWGHHGATFRPLGVFIGIVATLFCVLIGLMQLLKRLRSMGKQPYLSLLLLVPGVNILFILYAMAAPAKAK